MADPGILQQWNSHLMKTPLAANRLSKNVNYVCARLLGFPSFCVTRERVSSEMTNAWMDDLFACALWMVPAGATILCMSSKWSSRDRGAQSPAVFVRNINTTAADVYTCAHAKHTRRNVYTQQCECLSQPPRTVSWGLSGLFDTGANRFVSKQRHDLRYDLVVCLFYPTEFCMR